MPTTYYVDGSHGNDGNTGLSWVLAKASIGGAASLAVSGDTILVAPGIYAEAVTLAGGVTLQSAQLRAARIDAGTAITSTGNGVIVDGMSALGTAGASTPSIISTLYSITIRNCFLHVRTSNYSAILVQAALILETTLIMMENIYGGSQSPIVQATAGGSTIIGNSLIGSVWPGIYIAAASYQDVVIQDNIISSTSAYYAIHNTNANTITASHNRFVNSISASHYLAYRGVSYASLAAAQAAGYELSSADGVNPGFTDSGNLAYFLPLGSSLLTAGHTGGRIGALTAAKCFSSGGTAWNTWTGVNCSYVDNKWTLDDGQASGTVTSPVVDLGAGYDVTGLANDALQTFPTNVLDTTNIGGNPEYLTVEWRGQVASFLAGDPTPAWNEVQYNAEAAAVACRYIQVRLTLRSDGT